jgi:hypothetical protein
MQGKVTPAHFAQCVQEQQGKIGRQIAPGKLDWQISALHTCMANSIFSTEKDYIAYVGRVSVSGVRGLGPNEQAFIEVLCIWRFQGASVELANSRLEGLQPGKRCQQAKGASDQMTYRTN